MPWVDEVRKSLGGGPYFINYTDSDKGISQKNGPPGAYYLITYREDSTIIINNDKNYRFTHFINKHSNLNINFRMNHFLDDNTKLYKSSGAGGPAIFDDDSFDTKIDTSIDFSGVPSPLGIEAYTYYNTLNNREVNNIITYWFEKNLSNVGPDSHYIKEVKVDEIDFFINGYRRQKFSYNDGWSYSEDVDGVGEYHYIKYYLNSTGGGSGNINPPIFSTSSFEEIFIGSKISYDNCRYSFEYDLEVKSGTAVIKGYLIDSSDFDKWRTVGSGDFDFSNGEEISDIQITNDGSSPVTGITLSGFIPDSRNKYFVIRLDDTLVTTAGLSSSDTPIEFKIKNIKITGGYSNEKNNVLETSIPTSSTTSDISFEYNDGTNIQTSFIGNGKFLSGVWENGVWNNGIRTDNDSFQFDDVLNSYPISDGKWRIEIGKSSLLSTSERNLVGEFISIGNIVVININEERKFLKKSYLVVDVIDNYIAIEAEFSFPVRRIEKDSDKHRIKVSKNVWLSGAFLSGKFEGIWNDGVFKGNASNNVMDNTQWIDGVFDGGRFVSNYNTNGHFYNISGDFDEFNLTTVGISPNEIDNTLYPKLSVNDLNIVPLVGDFVNITNSKNYDGDSKILEVEQVGLVYNITIDKEYLPEDEIPVFISTNFATTGAYPSFSNKLQITYKLLHPTNFSVGNYVNISNVSNSTVTALSLNDDMKTTEGIVVEVLEIEEETTSIGQKIIFDTPATSAYVSEISSKSKYPYLSLVKYNLKLLISDGLVQNFTFNDNNISKLTSINTNSSSSIFKYNSWIDVNYDRNEAVNIGRGVNVEDSITGVNIPKNNLYGYPTSDVLSSKSKFRDSNTLNNKIYNLGTKFKKYTDFLGTASFFEDPFDSGAPYISTLTPPTPDITSFTDSGWEFTLYEFTVSPAMSAPYTYNSIWFKRSTPSLTTEGKELEIVSRENGGILNNSKINLEKNRYSIIEFDLINYISNYNGITDYLSEEGNLYPILSFSNLNYETIGVNVEQPMIYLPVYKNINLLNTPNSKKIEYFFNKRDLMMDIKGFDTNFANNERSLELTIDDLKIYEVDMIPFFKYFNESNIFKGIQKPLVGTSPFIEYTLNNFPFIESQSIPFDSIDIKTKE